MKKLYLLLTFLCLIAAGNATQVRGTVVDAQGNGLASGKLVFTLKGCDAPNTAYVSGFPSKPILYTASIVAGPGGVLLSQIIGNDQILCSGTPNTTYWHVDPYNGSTPTGVGGGDYVITGSTWNFNSASTTTTVPTTPAPSYLPLNLTGDETINIPAGVTLTFNGNVNIPGLTGGSGGGGGGTLTTLDWSQLTDVPTMFPPSPHTHPESDIVGLVADLASKQSTLGFTPENVANKNANNGYAGLDSGGLLPAGRLPTSVLLNSGSYTLASLWTFNGGVAASTYSSTGAWIVTSPTTTTPAAPVLNNYKIYFKAGVGFAQEDSTGAEITLTGLQSQINAANKYQLVFNSGGILTWPGMPSALTEFLSSANMRQQLDMSPFTEFRLVIGMESAGAAGSTLRVQYSTDGGTTWAYLQTGGATGHEVSTAAAGSPIVGSWSFMDPAAKGDFQIRVVGIGGDGSVSPQFRSVVVQFE